MGIQQRVCKLPMEDVFFSTWENLTMEHWNTWYLKQISLFLQEKPPQVSALQILQGPNSSPVLKGAAAGEGRSGGVKNHGFPTEPSESLGKMERSVLLKIEVLNSLGQESVVSPADWL